MKGDELLFLLIRVLEMALVVGTALPQLSARVTAISRVIRESRESGKPIDDSVIDELLDADMQLSKHIREQGAQAPT